MESLGHELRKQRELRQISLREVSDATKINLRFLEAIERNDFTHLPGGQFNKGFIRAYSRHIGVDPERMVEAYTQELQRQGDRTDRPEEPAPAPVPPLKNRALLVAILVFVAGTAVVLAIWLAARTGGPAAAAPPVDPPAGAAPGAGDAGDDGGSP